MRYPPPANDMHNRTEGGATALRICAEPALMRVLWRAVTACPPFEANMRHTFDLVIRNGTVADGTGAPLRDADIAIQDGRVAAVGTISDTGADEIDAKSLLITPGFVDIHTHYDGQATWDARLQPSSWHGVTTVVMGNCGVGFAPV